MFFAVVRPAVARSLVHDSRVQLAVVLLIGVTLRSLFFVGFSLGDDLGYIGHVTTLLNGQYPPLDPLNQYAYRPLLLYMFTAGVALFGLNDVGLVAPVLLASVATIAIVYIFVRRLVDSAAAGCCALLFACEPFNVVNSTTMTNDVILSCLVFAAVTAFLVADVEPIDRPMRHRMFVAAAVLLTCAFLIKVTILPALVALGLYSIATLRTRAAIVLRGHMMFYAALLVGLACICFVYYLKTGDPLWQFRSEFRYYDAYKPDWYLRGDINYAHLMSEYPQSLFGLSGYGSFTYFDHGMLFWLFVPAAVWVAVQRARVLIFLVLLTVVVFLFFQFYPQYVTPRYLPLVRQTRYLELLLPAVVVVVGTALHQLWRRQKTLGALVVILVLGDFVFEASRRSFLFNDSEQDMRALGDYVVGTIANTGKALAVDTPARTSLQFHARTHSIQLVSAAASLSADSYVAVGGARSFWWSRGLVFDVDVSEVPRHWVLAYEVPGLKVPWRPSNLRVYHVGGLSANAYPIVAPVVAESLRCRRPGLREMHYPAGFDRAPAPSTDVNRIPDIDDRTPVAVHLEWLGMVRGDDDIYTFETTSDDGSWMYLNNALVLDNGGTHPARRASRTVQMGRGWHSFRLQYENTGGEQFLQFRVHRGPNMGSIPEARLFCLELAGEGKGDAAPNR